MKRAYVYKTVGGDGGQKKPPSRIIGKPKEKQRFAVGKKKPRSVVIRKPHKTLEKQANPAWAWQMTIQALTVEASGVTLQPMEIVVK